eukprot:7383862-Prymnesium_polylepis.1
MQTAHAQPQERDSPTQARRSHTIVLDTPHLRTARMHAVKMMRLFPNDFDGPSSVLRPHPQL